MVVSVHQPNFWIYEGIVDKIRRSDAFVVLTRAQFSPGNYHNRFGMDGRWFTMGVSGSLEPLSSKAYTSPTEDWARIKRRLPRHAALASEFDDLITPRLADTNMAIIRRICSMLRIETVIIPDWETPLSATDRLVEICLRLGAKTYLSGQSGPAYLEMEKFRAAGIAVEVQDASALRRPALDVLASA